MVVDENDRQLQPLLERGDDLARHHQIGAVADQHVDLTFRRRQLDPEAARDLITHAGVPVLDVVALRVARPPELVQLARHRARGADDHVGGGGRIVDGADHLALRRQRRVAEPVEAGDLGVPFLVQTGRLLPIAKVDLVAGEQLGQRLQRLPRVAHERQAGELRRVEVGQVDVHEADVRMAERRLRGRREVGPPRPDAEDHVSLGGDAVGREGAGGSDRTQRTRMVERKRALARLRLGDGNPARFGEPPQRLRRLRIDDTAAGDHQRPPSSADEPGGCRECSLVGPHTGNVPDTPAQELLGEVPRLGLDVLRERERDRPGLGLVDEHAHGLERGRDQLLGPLDPVEVARHRLEAVVHRGVPAPGHLQLLEDGIRATGGEHVAGEEEHGQAVDGGKRRPGHHVGRPRADRARADERTEAVSHPGVAGGRVDHRLLVPGLEVREQLGALVQRFADPGDVAVAEDAEAAAEEAVLDAVALHDLLREEADESLRSRQPHATPSRSSASSCSSSASSRPPAIWRTSSWRSISDFWKLPRLRPRFRITNRSPTG